ncbi:AfsR/SARP family transcriptional regulator [Actinokineospora bangkokensis]|uniref:OmpR/PhoB-type domain-containing protein n=1 Tax=Actinokineospora bangkokensis TaxID=1193682 RepID=A0A1Q9LKF8_9PSEU|nr:AfsR/SARP family transcriptional regulator [Actinokineospora bangkokensis]OLR92484.1 hypothetical protein BJP25_20650 [Actinokineospora bangkokensis]
MGGARQRVVLSMLALNAGRVTPLEQLIDAVWDDEPPSTARGQIQFCISALRKVFTDAGRGGVIVTDPAGYLLDAADLDLDSARFTSGVAAAVDLEAEGRLADAAGELRAALALWRGPALAGVNSALVQRGAAHLEDSRLAAVERRVRLDLALGRHEEIIGELTALVAEEPLRERRYGFLMLALYRAERQAEALEVARRARATLVEELGVEPGQELRELEEAILNRDPALAARPPAEAAPAREPVVEEQVVVPRQLPASIADFTGREDQLAEIRDVLLDRGGDGADHADHAVRIVAISGKGGVGKSSLAVRVAHELREEFPDGQLYGDFRFPGDDRTGKLLERFLRALGVNGAMVPEDVQEQAELYRSLLATKRVLVVLDDVVGEEQVLPLLPGSPTCAVIATSRMRMTGLPGAHWVDVDAFDTTRSMVLLARIVGPARVSAEPGPAAELVGFCGGLPLALRIAGARLASKPHWRIASLVRRLQDETSRLDEFNYRGFELRFNIGLTYDELSAQAKRLFRLFALLRAPDFPAWTAAALLDTDLPHAEEVLEQLIDARLLDTVEFPGEQVRYRLHNLIRVYALERLLDNETRQERDAALQRVLGAWMGLAEQAHRAEYGGDYTILHGTAPRWQPPLPPGRTLLDELDVPADWWESERRSLVAAVRQAAAEGLDELCWDLALTAVTLFETKGYFDDWHETARLGLDLCERTGNRTGQAAMLYSLGTLHMFQKRLPDSQRCLAAAMALFEARGDTHGRALALRNMAITDGLLGDVTTMVSRLDSALALMREVGDRMGEAQVLRSIARFRIDEHDHEQGKQLLESALRICREVGCVRGEAQVLHQFAHLHLGTRDHAAAAREFTGVLRIVRSIGDRIGETYALYGLGVARYRQGRLVDAETVLRNAMALAVRVGERLVQGQTMVAIGEIRLALGDQRAAEAELSTAVGLFAELGSALWHAKALVLLAAAKSGAGGPVGDELRRARQLLDGVPSKEAARWADHLDALEAALPEDARAELRVS